MTEEQNIEETQEEVIEETTEETPVEENKINKRINELSGKIKLTSQERDELATAKTAVEQERDFYKDFSQTSAKYPQANEYQDKILEKVKSGYTVEDATVSVLNTEGKLIPQREDTEIVAGGSATIQTPDGDKSTGDMTQEERRKILEKELLLS